MGPYQRTPKEFARAIGYSGLGVRSVGSVGDFLISWNFGRLLVVLFFGCHESCFFLDFFSPGIGG